MPQWKALRYGKDDSREQSCGSTFIIHQDILKSENLLHKRGREGFLTPDSFHSTSLASWGSSWVSKEAKFIKEFDFVGFSRCFSVKIEQFSKNQL